MSGSLFDVVGFDSGCVACHYGILLFMISMAYLF